MTPTKRSLTVSKICSFGGCKSVAIPGSCRCEKHTVTYTPKKRLDHQLHDGKYIYGTARWQRLRNSHIRMYPLCAECARNALVKPGEVVDHVIEIKDGGDPWDPDNLQALCKEHHQKKSGEEIRKRKKNKGFKKLSDY